MKHISTCIKEITPSDVSHRQPRHAPLTEDQILKLDDVLCKFSTVKNKYGNVPVRDDNGKIYKWDFDIIGTERVFDENIPQRLIDSLLRPATRQAIASHVIRLAALVRDTRGREAMEVIAYEIARECVGVSEWAVVEACRDFWKSGATWYPSAGDLRAGILKKDKELNQALAPRNKMMIEGQEIMRVAKQRFGADVARAWFNDSRVENKILICDNEFQAQWIRNNYLWNIQDIVDQAVVEGKN